MVKLKWADVIPYDVSTAHVGAGGWVFQQVKIPHAGVKRAEFIRLRLSDPARSIYEEVPKELFSDCPQLDSGQSHTKCVRVYLSSPLISVMRIVMCKGCNGMVPYRPALRAGGRNSVNNCTRLSQKPSRSGLISLIENVAVRAQKYVIVLCSARIWRKDLHCVFKLEQIVSL